LEQPPRAGVQNERHGRKIEWLPSPRLRLRQRILCTRTDATHQPFLLRLLTHNRYYLLEATITSLRSCPHSPPPRLTRPYAALDQPSRRSRGCNESAAHCCGDAQVARPAKQKTPLASQRHSRCDAPPSIRQGRQQPSRSHLLPDLLRQLGRPSGPRRFVSLPCDRFTLFEALFCPLLARMVGDREHVTR
jgi:hypothetical protein